MHRQTCSIHPMIENTAINKLQGKVTMVQQKTLRSKDEMMVNNNIMTCKSAVNAAYDTDLSVGRRNLQCQRHAVMIERFVERDQCTMYARLDQIARVFA